jgi:hypothetical protein
LNSEKIWKIQKKIVTWYGKYGRKVGGDVGGVGGGGGGGKLL